MLSLAHIPAHMLKGEKTLVGWLVILGLLTQVSTSRLFESMQDFIKPYMTVRDFICMLGQDIGELMYAAGFWILFKKSGYFLAAVEFWISLLFIDLLVIILTNPYEPSWPKDTGLIFAMAIALIRMNKYIKNE
jgi:hypothetical protein